MDIYAINFKAETLLSSMGAFSDREKNFYGPSYGYHPGLEGERDAHYAPDPESAKQMIDMGDKSRFWDDPDIVAIGCSFTQMGALPYAFNWPKIIEHTQNLKVNNCGQPASGVNFQLGFACDVMRKHGFPKSIFALFPNMERAFMPAKVDVDEEKVHLRNIDWDYDLKAFVARNEPFKQGMNQGYDEFYISSAKKRYQVPKELVVFQSLLHIEIFETMCDAAGIAFKFSTWHPREIMAFKNMLFKSYAPPFEFDSMNSSVSKLASEWKKDVELDSRLFSVNNQESYEAGISYPVRPWELFGVNESPRQCDHEPQSDLQSHFWVRASDGRHVGLHDQIHFAEHFIQKRISNQDIARLPENRIN